jgi:hypothetical protein
MNTKFQETINEFKNENLRCAVRQLFAALSGTEIRAVLLLDETGHCSALAQALEPNSVRDLAKDFDSAVRNGRRKP